MLQERARRVDRRTLEFTPCDAALYVEHFFKRCTEIAHAGNASHEVLFRCRRNNRAPDFRGVHAIPIRVVAVPHQHQVHVHIPEPGQHVHALGRHHRHASGNGERANLTDRDNALAVNQDDAVFDRGSTVPVDECATHQGERDRAH